MAKRSGSDVSPHGNPTVMAGKDCFRGVLFRFPPTELTAPDNACSRACAGTGVPVFGIPGSCLIGRVVPVLPAFRQDMAAKLAPHEERCGIRAPRPAEVNPFNTVGRCEPAPVEDISELMILNGGGGSDI